MSDSLFNTWIRSYVQHYRQHNLHIRILVDKGAEEEARCSDDEADEQIVETRIQDLSDDSPC